MARYRIRNRVPFTTSFLLAALAVSEAGAGWRTAHAVGAPTVAMSVPDRLVVRARAGLQARTRRSLFAAHGASEAGTIDALGAIILRVPRGRLRTLERVLRGSRLFKSVERDYYASAAQIPDDPEFSKQWGLTKLRVPEAWSVTRGASSLTVAVVDSGVDAAHPDLQHRVLPGYDFVNDDAEPFDDNGHGTRMAGIIAAEAFNALGVAGVAPDCALLPVKVLDQKALGSYSRIASGIIYATDHGARVINLSLTGPAHATVLEAAVDYAAARGVVVVAAAGNSGSDDPTYPAAYANAVAVAATTESDKIASFSNSGAWLALAAPGVDVLTTGRGDDGDPTYVTTTGTSPATAFASGAFALVLSAAPQLSGAAALAALQSSAKDIDTKGWDPNSGWGRVDVVAAFGASGIPLPASTTRPDRRRPRVRVTAPRRNVPVAGNVPVDVTASDNVGVAMVELLVDDMVVARDTAAPFQFIWDSAGAAPGKHTLRARAADAAGNVRLSAPVRVRVPE
jgi:subtilisin family serine protease